MNNKQQFNRKHGSLYDRGQADYYYWRSPSPHWYPNGTGNGERIPANTTEERQEYMAGYDEAERQGDRKEYY